MGTGTQRFRIALALLLALAAAGTLAAQTPVTIVKSTNGQDANSPPGPVVAVGSPISWTYLVTNGGGRDLTAVSVTDDRGVTVTCPSTTLAAGSSMTCTATGAAIAGQYANVGTVSATETGGGPVTASDPSHYFGQPPGLITLVKSTNGQDANTPPGPVVAPGSAITWTYVATNTGSDPLTAVSVTDDQGVTVTCPSTTLAAGSSMTCTATGNAVAGQYSNVGMVSATHPVVGTIVATDPSHYFGQNTSLDFGDAPDTYGTSLAANGARHVLGTGVYLGACVDYELDGQPTAAANGDDTNAGASTTGACGTAGADEDGVTFNGSMVAGQNASITVVASAPCTLSAWIDFDVDGTFVSAGDNLFPGGTALAAGSNALPFGVPSTAAGGATYARFRCTTDGAVTPTGVARDGEVEDYQVTVVPAADLSVAKIDSPDPVVPGTNLTWAITVTNAGPSTALTAVLSDTLPAGTTFVSLAAPAGWSCTTPVVGSSGTLSCAAAAMAPGAAAFTVVVAVGPTVAPGAMISNTASASSPTLDLVPGNNSATAVTTVGAGQADLSVSKSGSPDPVTPGTNATYTITLNNAGPSNATSVTLSDPLPAGVAFVSSTAPAGWNCTTPAVGSNGTISCTAASLPPASIAFTIVVSVDPAQSSGSSLTNSATASSATTDPAPGSNTGTATTTVGGQRADLSITKADGPDPVVAGASLTYTIAVINAGPSYASSAVLADVLPAETTFVSVASPAGWTCTAPAPGATGTVSCTAASLAPGTSVFTLVTAAEPSLADGLTISNTATVSSAAADPSAANNSGTATTTTLSAGSIPLFSAGALALLLLVLAGFGIVMIRKP